MSHARTLAQVLQQDERLQARNTASNIALLQKIPEFRFVSPKGIRSLAAAAVLDDYRDGDVLLRVRERGRYVYVVLSGSLFLSDFVGEGAGQWHSSHRHIGKHMTFGFTSCLLDEPSDCQVNIVGPTQCLLLPWSTLRALLRDPSELRFSLAIATHFRNQGIFAVFDAYVSGALNQFIDGHMSFDTLLKLYRELHPAIHSEMKSADLDVNAWLYAARRLPENINSAYAILVSRNLIDVLRKDDRDEEGRALRLGRMITTRDRRRVCYEVTPGKLFVMIREGSTDVVDLLTCLCLHAVELQKLRHKLKPTSVAIRAIGDALRRIEAGESREKVEIEVLSSLPNLTTAEWKGLRQLWPGRTLEEIERMLAHHGDYALHAEPGVSDFSTTQHETWIGNIQKAAEELIGPLVDQDGNPRSIIVDIISSNTHSVINCLSPYLHSLKDRIMEWGRTNHPEIKKEEFHNEDDCLYAFSAFFFDTFRDEAEARRLKDREAGIISVNTEPDEMTGIAVQLVNINQLCKSAGTTGLCDSALPKLLEHHDDKCHLVVNIDYAFGEQAYDVLQGLVMIFGSNIRSVNVLGKAGGLIGKRGDILFPTHLILEKYAEGTLRSVPNDDISPEELHEVSRRDVHVGPVLTIMGTLLQNARLLRFYNLLWRVTGLEMEGSYYLKCIEQNIMMGLLNPDLKSRFLYYVSDLPLGTGTTLAAKMTLSEGMPPLYAITRVILRKVFEHSIRPESAFKPPAPKKSHWTDVINQVTSGGSLQGGRVVPLPMCARPSSTAPVVPAVGEEPLHNSPVEDASPDKKRSKTETV